MFPSDWQKYICNILKRAISMASLTVARNPTDIRLPRGAGSRRKIFPVDLGASDGRVASIDCRRMYLYATDAHVCSACLVPDFNNVIPQL